MPQIQKPPDILDDAPQGNIQVNKPPDILDDEPTVSSASVVPDDAPDSYLEGVMDSFQPDFDNPLAYMTPIGAYLSSKSGQSGLEGAKGYLKGAVLDLPSSIWGGLKSVANAALHPIDTVKNLPQNIADTVSGMADTTMMAGSDPEAFGRMMGQVTGQPAVTAGVAKGVPPAIKMAGTPVAAAGRVMKNYQPLSGVLPGAIEPRLLRIAESMAGRGIEKLGNRMKGSPAPLEGELMPAATPDIMEGNFNEVMPEMPAGLPPGRRTFYGPESMPVEEPMVMPQGQPALPPAPEQLALPPSRTHFMGPSEVGNSRVFEHVGPSPASVSKPSIPPKMRVNSEGNLVDLNTGNTIDQTGKVISSPVRLSEILEKPFHEMSFEELSYLAKQNLDKNVAKTVKTELAKRSELPRTSPFFYKNRKY